MSGVVIFSKTSKNKKMPFAEDIATILNLYLNQTQKYRFSAALSIGMKISSLLVTIYSNLTICKA